MAEIKLVGVNSISKGSYIIIDGAPCKVVDITTSKPGKHGAAKARIEAIGLLDGQKRVIIKGTSDKVEAPIIEKRSAQVLSVHGNIVNVMDLETYETFDLEIPEEFKDKLKEGSTLLYWVIMDHKVIKQVRD